MKRMMKCLLISMFLVACGKEASVQPVQLPNGAFASTKGERLELFAEGYSYTAPGNSSPTETGGGNVTQYGVLIQRPPGAGAAQPNSYLCKFTFDNFTLKLTTCESDVQSTSDWVTDSIWFKQ